MHEVGLQPCLWGTVKTAFMDVESYPEYEWYLWEASRENGERERLGGFALSALTCTSPYPAAAINDINANFFRLPMSIGHPADSLWILKLAVWVSNIDWRPGFAGNFKGFWQQIDSCWGT